MTQNIQDYHFITELQSFPWVEEIALFGSRARGDNQQRSDIDLAITCVKNATEDSWIQILNVIENADTLLKIDCIRFDQLKASDPLYQNILQYKKILYKKKTWKDSFFSLGHAISRLEEAVLHVEQNEYIRDASIQRFEFVIELFWKVLKKILSYEKIEGTTPRDVIEKAYQFHLIDGEKIWLNMLTDRNNTSHVYKEEDARKVFENIKEYLPVFKKTHEALKEKYDF